MQLLKMETLTEQGDFWMDQSGDNTVLCINPTPVGGGAFSAPPTEKWQ